MNFDSKKYIFITFTSSNCFMPKTQPPKKIAIAKIILVIFCKERGFMLLSLNLRKMCFAKKTKRQKTKVIDIVWIIGPENKVLIMSSLVPSLGVIRLIMSWSAARLPNVFFPHMVPVKAAEPKATNMTDIFVIRGLLLFVLLWIKVMCPLNNATKNTKAKPQKIVITE